MIDAALLDSLRSHWVREYGISEEKAWQLCHSLIEVGFKADELPNVIAQIATATQEGDSASLYVALHEYWQLMWQLSELQYIEFGLAASDELSNAVDDRLIRERGGKPEQNDSGTSQ